jgi:nitroreductase
MTNQGVSEHHSPVVRALHTRRSIREGFTDQRVSEQDIIAVLVSAQNAASSKNSQPWRLHVVTTDSILKEIAGYVESARDGADFVPHDPVTGRRRKWRSTTRESAHVLSLVPLAIIVENTGPFSGGRRAVATARGKALESALIGYAIEMVSHGIAIDAMMTAAMDLGLSGVIMGDVLVAEEQIQERLGFEGDLVAVLALGYSDARPYPKSLKDLEEIVVRHLCFRNLLVAQPTSW